MVDLGAARADLERRLGAEFGRRVARWTEIAGGRNNRLFRIDTSDASDTIGTEDGGVLLGKFYGRDRWGGLAQEFAILTLLGARGFPDVPRAYLRSDAHAYAVYSFEPGVIKTPGAYTTADLRAVAAFAAALHALAPEPSDAPLPPPIEACCSLADQLAVIDRRLAGFEEFAADPAAPAEVRALGLRAELDRLIARATAGLTPEELARPIPRAAWRLNNADFGPHNILIREDGGEASSLTVVDFEWGGWADPARLAMGFVAHAGSEGLSDDGRATFLGAYAAARALSSAEIARFERVGALYDIEWVAVYASALTTEGMANAEFAVADFDASAHRAAALARLEARLARARAGGGYRFPPGAGRGGPRGEGHRD